MTDYDGRTALHVAACEGQGKVIETLLAEGADSSMQDRWNGTAVEDALRYRHEECARLLGAYVVDKNLPCMPTAGASGDPVAQPTASENTPLLRGVVNAAEVRELNAAAASGDVNELRRLQRKGVQLSIYDYDLRGPLHVAAAEGQILMVKYLLSQQGVNINAQDRMRNTPLADAQRESQEEVAAWLLEQGATVIQDNLGHKLCQYAAEGELAQLEKQRGVADFNTADYDGRCALHLAACAGRMDVVQFLCNMGGANVNVKDRWGGTPLADAERHGMEKVAKFLREKGARDDTSVKLDSETARQIDTTNYGSAGGSGIRQRHPAAGGTTGTPEIHRNHASELTMTGSTS